MTVEEVVTIHSILTSVKGAIPALAGMQLTFFISACMVLCSGSVAETVLITP